jgi:hypothetical protein
LPAALSLAQQAVAAADRELGTDHPQLAPLLTDLAILHMELGELNMARPFLSRAYRILRSRLPFEHPLADETLRRFLLRISLPAHRQRKKAELATPHCPALEGFGGMLRGGTGCTLRYTDEVQMEVHQGTLFYEICTNQHQPTLS